MRYLKSFLESPQKIFLLLATVFGILTISFTSPFKVPDEAAHFIRAYEVSEGVFLPTIQNNLTVALLPKQLKETLDVVDKFAFSNSKITLQDLNPNGAKIDYSDKVLVRSATGQYSPFPYIVTATSLKVVRVFSDNPLTLYFCGKIMALLSWTTMIFLAIKIIPFGRWLMLLLALLPIHLFLAPSFSADSAINSATFLLIAIVLQLHYSKDTVKYLRLKLCTVVFLLLSICLSKTVYIFLLPLLFLIPARYFHNRTRYFIYGGSTLLLVIGAHLFWFNYIHGLHEERVANVFPKEQLAFILSDPSEFLKIMLTSAKDNFSGYICSFIGILGWLDIHLSAWIYCTYPVVLLSSLFFTDKKEISIHYSLRLLSLIIFLIGALIIAVALYCTWNPLRSPVLNGIQGRYFISFSLLGALPFFALPHLHYYCKRQWVLGAFIMLYLNFVWVCVEVILKSSYLYY
jgi:uncharacterized membrane protein